MQCLKRPSVRLCAGQPRTLCQKPRPDPTPILSEHVFLFGDVDRESDGRVANYVKGELGEDWNRSGRLGIVDLPDERKFFSTICGGTIACFVWWRILKAVSQICSMFEIFHIHAFSYNTLGISDASFATVNSIIIYSPFSSSSYPRAMLSYYMQIDGVGGSRPSPKLIRCQVDVHPDINLSKLFTLTSLCNTLRLQVHCLPSRKQPGIEYGEPLMGHLRMIVPKPDMSYSAPSWVVYSWC